MRTISYEDSKRTYVQSQRILRIYSDFLYVNTEEKTKYQIEKSNAYFLEEHNFNSFFVYDSLPKNVSNLCRVIRLFAVGTKNIVNNPFSYNGFQLLDLCFHGFKLNCAGCSVVLNDILLTLGYKSKCVCCIPYDAEDFDTHVVVHVFDEDNGRWFVADPALGQVPCNENGEGMDILTLRKYLSEENSLPFFRSGKLHMKSDECSKYASKLVDKMFMFIVFDNSGLIYNFYNTKLIVPDGVRRVSNKYNVCKRTNNASCMYD